jgi:type IV secretion system protein VirB4
MTHANNAPWFTKAGAATSILPISHFVGPHTFALKGGGYGCLFSLEGIDPESRTDEDLDVRVRGVEASLRGLPEDSCGLRTFPATPSPIDLACRRTRIRKTDLAKG